MKVSKMKQSSNPSVQELLLALRPPRHPKLVARDAAYAAAVQMEGLTPEGDQIMDPMPVAVELIGLRPLTLEEQVQKYTDHGVMDFNLVPDLSLVQRFPEHYFTAEDDFGDYLEDLPEEGFSPYELAALENIRDYNARMGFDYMAEEDLEHEPVTSPEPSPERPQKAGGGEGDPEPGGSGK